MSNVIEEAAAKAAGKFAAVQATVRGLRGVFRKLAEEHKEIAILLKRAGTTSDSAKRVNLWAKVRAEMMAHEQAELQQVYPAFEAHPDLADVVTVHELEANEMMGLIERLDHTPIDAPQWVLVLRAIEQVWTKHAEREENQFFPRVQGVIGNARAEQLELSYVAARNALLTRM